MKNQRLKTRQKLENFIKYHKQTKIRPESLIKTFTVGTLHLYKDTWPYHSRYRGTNIQ